MDTAFSIILEEIIKQSEVARRQLLIHLSSDLLTLSIAWWKPEQPGKPPANHPLAPYVVRLSQVYIISRDSPEMKVSTISGFKTTFMKDFFGHVTSN